MADQASEISSPSDHPLKLRSGPDYQQHARERLKQHEAERNASAAERKAGRLVGKLSDSLYEKLKNCNPLQLQEVMRLARKFEALHRKPPSLSDCRVKYTVEVVHYVDVRNRRFTLEFRRTSKRADRVYVNGPYVVAHWRDGAITKHQYFKSKDIRKRIPRKVWDGFREVLASPKTEEQRKRLNEHWRNETE
jgi:hypothetical protein